MTAPSWWRARSLAERARDVRAAGDVDGKVSAAGDGAVAGAGGTAAGEARARLWEQVLPDAEILAERLRAAGVDGVGLGAVLADRPPPRDGAEPEWWTWVEQTLVPGTRSPVRDGDDEQDADVLRGALRLVAPFARRVRAALREHPAARTDAIRLLTHNIAFELAELCRPAVAMELAATRAAERWPASSARARAAALLRTLGGAEEALALLAEHPGLARMIACRSRLAAEAGGELLERFDDDLPRVRAELLGDRDPGPITALDPAGDSHDGGRRVMRVGFESGAQVALKPRSLAPDLTFQRLLAELTRLGFEPGFRVLVTIAAGPSHGWQEWAQPADCGSPACVERYYRRLGGQLALLHALHAVDLHQENVLACGEHPVLVDLEGILHPRLGGSRARFVDPLIAETGMDCVLRVGLLPRADVAFGVDIGGLGRDPRGRVSVNEVRWVGDGGDAHLAEEAVVLHAGANAPRLDGELVRPQEYVEALASGFADAYRLLVAHRDSLLAPGGALAAFADVPIRFILRPTKVYADLLRRQCSDPGALDDGLAREEALNVLWRGGRRRPDLRLAAAAEHHDLWEGDIPKITGSPGNADAHHHALGTLEGLLGPHPAPGPEAVRRLDEDDLERQLSWLRTSVLAAAAAAELPAAARAELAAAASAKLPAAARAEGSAGAPADGADGAPSGAPPPRLSRRQALDGALAAARRLGVLALRDGDHAGWLTPVAAPGHPGRVLRAAGPGFADGQAGIALFLALAAAQTGDEPTAALAFAATRRLLDQLEAQARADHATASGADAAATRLALAGLAAALDDEALRLRARDLAAKLAKGAGDAPAGPAARAVSSTRRGGPEPAPCGGGPEGLELAGLRGGLAGEGLEVPGLRGGLTDEGLEVPALRGGLAGEGVEPPGLRGEDLLDLPGLRGGVAGVGLRLLASFDQIAADAAAAALLCSAP